MSEINNLERDSVPVFSQAPVGLGEPLDTGKNASVMPGDADAGPYPHFPRELKDLPRWVTWKVETRDGKPTKVPYNARTGERAKTTDPATWVDYSTAVAAREGYAGVGCVIAPPFCAIDLDKCRDLESGKTEGWAKAIIKEIDSYTELSPSGRGFHIWVRGELSADGRRRAGRVEMYDCGRYFTVTGQHLPGTPLTVETRDLRSFQFRIPNLDPTQKKPAIQTEPDHHPPNYFLEKFDELMAGRWEPYYQSASQADLGLCVLLVRRYGGDSSIIEAEFNKSGLATRAKWKKRPDYRNSTIARAIHFVRGDAIAAENTIAEDESQAPPGVPICAAEIIDGDHIGGLTRLLTTGTSIPAAFVRQNIKTILGAMIDSETGFPGQGDLHTRQYTVNVSLRPRTGKGVAWERTGDAVNGVLAGMLDERKVRVLDGGFFGSGEHMVKKLQECADKAGTEAQVNVLARFDEMAEPFEKAKATGSTLETKLLQLFQRNSIAAGSFKNGEYNVQNTHFSFVGDFTRDGFEKTFTGRGSSGSGFLSRCTYAFADRTPRSGDWLKIDQIAVTKALADISQCMDRLREPDAQVLDDNPFDPGKPLIRRRFIPEETDAAREMRWEFLRRLQEDEDPRYTPELDAHFKRDLLMRVIFSDDPRIDEIRTQKSISWTLHQLDIRKVLWPEDAGSPVEQMEQRILKALVGRPFSASKLIDHCNVNRPGSGGREVFNRALKALTASGDIWVDGKTQRGVSIYTRCPSTQRSTQPSLDSQIENRDSAIVQAGLQPPAETQQSTISL